MYTFYKVRDEAITRTQTMAALHKISEHAKNLHICSDTHTRSVSIPNKSQHANIDI